MKTEVKKIVRTPNSVGGKLTTDKKSNFIEDVTIVEKAPPLEKLLREWGDFPSDPAKKKALREARLRELKKQQGR